MKRWLILVLILVIPLSGCTKQPNGDSLFMSHYEDDPTITKTTYELRIQIINDTKKGDYWADEVHWLENAKSAGKIKNYWIDPKVGNAMITSDVAHSGIRSVEIEVSAVPSGWYYVTSLLARYIRNQSLIVNAVYEFGAWFYVPKGNVPITGVGLEYHPYWLKQYFAYAGVKSEDGSVFAMDDNEAITIGNVDFQHDTWFKLWIVWDTRAENFILGYKSPVEEKTFEVDWIWAGGWNFAYVGYKAFNFYAGAGNLQSESKQKFYVDDFYAKVVG